MKVEPGTGTEPTSPQQRQGSPVPPSHLDSPVEPDETCERDKKIVATHGLSFLKQFVQLVQDKTISFPACRPFHEEAEAILKLDDIPRVLVGVLGYTGSGKSSLINALVDEEMLLPCNAMRASTSAVVELSWNKSSIPSQAYTAEVEFISEKEWLDELELLRLDIKDRPEGEQLTSKSSSEASASYSKLSAVYPGIDIAKLIDMPPKKLLKITDLSKILGQTKIIYGTKANAFHKEIKAYIDSSNHGGRSGQIAYWPLIRLIKIYTKVPILQSGLVLVDLPGVGDSNAGRRQVAERYMKSLDHVWIVADIVRAVDDQIAKDLMGRTFRTRLLMDGKYNAVTFIMTKTDNINPDEVISSLNLGESGMKSLLEEETQLKEALEEAKEGLQKCKNAQKEFRKELKSLSAVVKGTKSATGRKRKHSETESAEPEVTNPGNSSGDQSEQLRMLQESMTDSKKQAQKLETLIRQKNKMLNKQIVLIKSGCITERNIYTQTRLKEDFERGFRELDQELKEAEDNDRPEVERQDLLRDLETFCISSKAFQKLKGRFPRDADIVGFDTVQATNIPRLHDFAVNLTSGERSKIVDAIFIRWNSLKHRLNSWVKERDLNVDIDLSSSQVKALREALEKSFSMLQTSTEKDITKSVKNIRTKLTKQVTKKIPPINLDNWEKETIYSEEYSASNIHFQTWRAICFEWNAGIADGLLRSVSRPWKKVFQDRIFQVHKDHSSKVVNLLQEFLACMEQALMGICETPYAPGNRVLEQIRLRQPIFEQSVAEAYARFKEDGQSCHRGLEPLIKEKIRPAYETCCEQRGKGSLLKMKEEFTKFFEDNADEIYSMSIQFLKKRFNIMTETNKKLLKSASSELREVIRREFEEMISNATPKPGTIKPDEEKLALQESILQKLNQLEETLQKELENPESELKAADPFARCVSDVHKSDESDEDEDDSDLSSEADCKTNSDVSSDAENSNEKNSDEENSDEENSDEENSDKENSEVVSDEGF
ncbi:uncharacterized protein BP5553_02741 [Venustampulla echinocandica]|uniref:P-loop containing nucleoside triphosphate hydrolase n=1 Tax=Venustampulla echinocandica TaxID=2656787 RepID=A0A370TSA4_9HELO|nr:uncharacterized protein BP5553_02741 [Venustampulla echinocandica]RDL38401.1 hypothetical protein BP5553_02741 [Venustampulla echinocandica]